MRYMCEREASVVGVVRKFTQIGGRGIGALRSRYLSLAKADTTERKQVKVEVRVIRMSTASSWRAAEWG